MYRSINSGFLLMYSSSIDLDSRQILTRLTLPEEMLTKVTIFSSNSLFGVYFIPEQPSALDCIVFKETADRVVFFSGSLYSNNSADLVKTSLFTFNTESELESILLSITGVFTGVVFLKHSKELYTFIDQLGVKKSFYMHNKDFVAVSSHFSLISFLNSNNRLSNFAFGSILYSGHLFSGSLFDSVSQVTPGCYLNISNNMKSENEYIVYPQPVFSSFSEAVRRVKDAHTSLWRRLKPKVDNSVSLFLSRGKDARIVLKYMLDAGISPHIASFWRNDTSYYPFVSTLLRANDDYLAAKAIASNLSCDFSGIRIPNSYLISNLDRIVTLNHGTPLHWEFLAMAEEISEISDFVVTGFIGDLIAGKSHHYYLFKKIHTASEYADIEFRKAGAQHIYSSLVNIFRIFSYRDLPSFDFLNNQWRNQYIKCKSDNLNHVFQQGLMRTRGLGRVGPTFDQMRLFVHPIYPYNDTELIDAYRSIPDKYLRWEKAHVAQLIDDPRFNSVPTTRLNVSVHNEFRLLKPIGLLRKIDSYRKGINAKKVNPLTEVESAMRKTLADLGIDKEFWKTCSTLPKTPGFYRTMSNLISVFRIEASLIDNSSNFKFSESNLPTEMHCDGTV